MKVDIYKLYSKRYAGNPDSKNNPQRITLDDLVNTAYNGKKLDR